MHKQKNILLLDTSIASSNKGDDIIMECIRKELSFLLHNNFELTLPTHISPFNWYQVLRKSLAVRKYSNCPLKFVGGTNLLIPDLLTHYPQWNINPFNSQPLKGCILMGVGAGVGAESKINAYTRHLYRNLLSSKYIHSVRDERTKNFTERLGFKAINTGCPTMWILTPEFCKNIPRHKSDTVVFTLTASNNPAPKDQHIIDCLNRNYDNIYFWPQGIHDFEYLHKLKNIDNISLIPANKDAYAKFLSENQTDYIGTRLHGGIYAMRHKRRSIIIAIDERATAINEKNNLLCINKADILALDDFINQEHETKIAMSFDKIAEWKSQFLNF